MRRSRAALAVLIGVIVVVLGVSVVSFAAANRSDSDSVKSDDVALSASVSKDRPHSTMLSGISNIKASKVETTKITLTWDTVDDAAGYYVYFRDIDKVGEYSLSAKVKKPTAAIDKLTPTTRYQFRVTAYTQKDGVIYECPASEIEVLTKTGEVSNLQPERSSDVLKFSWAKTDKATGYDIHRACKATDNKFEFCKSVNSTTTEFEDKDVKEGELYTYRVIPFRTVNNVKYYSEEGKTISLISGLGAPADLMAISSNTRVTLYWKAKKLASGYNIYMAEDKNGKYKLLGNTDDTSYSTEKLTADKTYYFRVQPYKKINKKTVNGTWSNLSIKAAKESGESNSTHKSNVAGSGTYVEVSIKQQHLWFYEKGKLTLETDVVTGNADGECDTPTGKFTMTSRALDTTLTGTGYSSFVNYWMGFYGGYGIHDASWRSSFGGTIYKGNGSHGCVNTPFDKVKYIYEHTDYGTPVYVY